MKNTVKIISIFIGISILILWTMLLLTGNMPKLISAPISITFHLIAEFSMGFLILFSGIAVQCRACQRRMKNVVKRRNNKVVNSLGEHVKILYNLLRWRGQANCPEIGGGVCVKPESSMTRISRRTQLN